MAPIFFAYSFDLKAFEQFLVPWRGELEQGYYARLVTYARDRALEDAETRLLLDSVFLAYVYDYDPPLLDKEDWPSAEYCLLTLMKPYMRPLPRGTAFGEAGSRGLMALHREFVALDWRQADAKLAFFGLPLCQALSIPAPSAQWCRPPLGVLTNFELQTLKAKGVQALVLLRNQEVSTSLNQTLPAPLTTPMLAEGFAAYGTLLDECLGTSHCMLVTIAS